MCTVYQDFVEVDSDHPSKCVYIFDTPVQFHCVWKLIQIILKSKWWDEGYRQLASSAFDQPYHSEMLSGTGWCGTDSPPFPTAWWWWTPAATSVFSARPIGGSPGVRGKLFCCLAVTVRQVSNANALRKSATLGKLLRWGGAHVGFPKHFVIMLKLNRTDPN